MLERGRNGFRESNEGDDEFNRKLRRRLMLLGAAVLLSPLSYAIYNLFLDTDDDYIRNASSPHSQNASIPEGRAFPLEAAVQFDAGTAEYEAPPEFAAKSGLLAVLASCGNPADKHDPHNLYVSLGKRKEDGSVWFMDAGIKDAPACADGTLTPADRSLL